MLAVAYLAWSIRREPVKNTRMAEVAGYIRTATRAFIKRQYKTIAVFIALVLIPLSVFEWRVAVAFVFGAFLSLLAAL